MSIQLIHPHVIILPKTDATRVVINGAEYVFSRIEGQSSGKFRIVLGDGETVYEADSLSKEESRADEFPSGGVSYFSVVVVERKTIYHAEGCKLISGEPVETSRSLLELMACLVSDDKAEKGVDYEAE